MYSVLLRHCSSCWLKSPTTKNNSVIGNQAEQDDPAAAFLPSFAPGYQLGVLFLVDRNDLHACSSCWLKSPTTKNNSVSNLAANNEEV